MTITFGDCEHKIMDHQSFQKVFIQHLDPSTSTTLRFNQNFCKFFIRLSFQTLLKIGKIH